MNIKIKFNKLLALTGIALVAGCGQQQSLEIESLKNTAKEYFTGVYSGDKTAVAELVAEDVQISYPIFRDLFGYEVIEGKQAVLDFVERFARKWKNPKSSFEKVIAEGNTVVLLWSFSATDSAQETEGGNPENGRTSWGGISIIQFNEEGEVSMEIGEESSPGPVARIFDNHQNL